MSSNTAGQEVSPALAKSMQFHLAGQEKQRAGDHQKALMFYQAAINTCPLNGVPYASLIKLLVDRQDWSNVVKVATATPAAVYQGNFQIQFFHAISLIECDDLSSAKDLLQELIDKPGLDNGSIYNNLGTCFNRLEQYDTALTWYRKADECGFDDVMFLVNIAGVFNKVGDVNNARKYYQRGVARYPDNDDLLYEFAIFCLKTEDFAEGFRLYQHRFGAQGFGARPFTMPIPPWRGNRAVDRLLVVLEQGVGDQVLYSALLSEIKRQVPALTVAADVRLLPLLARTHPDVRLLDHGEATDSEHVRSCDAFLHGADMGVFGASCIGQWGAFLQADEQRVSALRARYQARFPGKKLVGIAWRSKREVYGPMKSVALELWLDLLRCDDVQFISFQYGDVLEELAQLREQHGIDVYVDPDIDSFNDLDGVAAQAKALDLVITTSNSNAHLAAASGANTWLIAPIGAGLLWYWGMQGERCAWYPQARVFRQSDVGEWQGVMSSVASGFKQFLESNNE